MTQSRCRHSFLLEASQPLRIKRNKTGQDLNSYFSPQPRVAGSIDLAHAACSQQGLNLVVADPSARGQFDRGRGFQETGLFRIALCQQGFHFATQSLVAVARLSEECQALFGLESKRVLKHVFDLLPTLWGHASSLRRNSLCNHKRAIVHSRLTVAGDTWRT